MDLQKGCRRLAAWVLTLALTAALALPPEKSRFSFTGICDMLYR